MKNGRPINLLPLLVAVGHPLARDRASFEAKFCAPRMTPFGVNVQGAAHLNELRVQTAEVVLRRTKAQCMDLPPKVCVCVYVCGGVGVPGHPVALVS